jgi:hypothetical protein
LIGQPLAFYPIRLARPATALHGPDRLGKMEGGNADLEGEQTMADPTPRKPKPTRLVTRLRAILGGDEDRLPRVGVETLRQFHDYLVGHLSFPFDGRLSEPIGPHQDTESPLSVIRLMDPRREYSPEEMHGLICQAEQQGHRIELPLDRIDVTDDSPYSQLLEDYRHWQATCQ